MFTILYLGLLVMCCLTNYFHRNKQHSSDYSKICLTGMVCSGLTFLWSLMYLFDSIGTLFLFESNFEKIRVSGYESTARILYGDTIRETESLYGLTILFIFIFIAFLILSGYSFFKYRTFWQSCYKRCPKCSEKINVKAKLCHYCEYEFSEDDSIQNIQKKTNLVKSEMMNKKNIFSYYILSFKNCFNFLGKSSRREYWYTQLAESLIIFISYILMGIIAGIFQENYEGFVSLYLILIISYTIIRIIPSWSLTVRRLHDSGKSGWISLIQLIPYVGGIIIIPFMAMKSKTYENYTHISSIDTQINKQTEDEIHE